VNLKKYAATLSHYVPVRTCSCWLGLAFSYAQYNALNKVLPVKWVPPTWLRDGDGLQIWAEASDNRPLNDCCWYNHLSYNKITVATDGLRWHGPCKINGPIHVLGTSVHYRAPQLQVLQALVVLGK
jgi:hypothetical protein